jgi:hypothetical protein
MLPLFAVADEERLTIVTLAVTLLEVASLSEGCTAFVTNDRRLPSLPGLRFLQVGDHT